MKFFTMTIATMISMLAILSACSFDPNSSSDPNEKRDDQTLREETAILESVKGNYTGTLDSTRGTEKAILRLTYYNKDQGSKDSHGQERYLPAPTAKLILPESDDLDANMEGEFNNVAGLLTLTTRKTDKGYDGPNYKVNVHLVNGGFVGDLQSGSGMLVGKLNLPVKDTEVLTPRKEDQEQYDRHKCWLNRIIGRYLFDVKPYDTSYKPYQMSLALNFEDTVTDTGAILPVVVARGRGRTDGYAYSGSYSVIYRDDITPETISLKQIGTLKGYSDFTINAKFRINATTGETTLDGDGAWPTFTATIHAVRDPSTVAAPCK